MITILEYHKDGDPRFAAEEARLAGGQSITEVYQGAKRDEGGHPYEHPETVLSPFAVSLWGQNLPVGDKHFRRHMVYLMLWVLYFQEHPDLLVEACRYDAFRSSPQARCWYPRDTYPGLDEDHPIEHLGIHSGSTGRLVRAVTGHLQQSNETGGGRK
jgi:hypothetical protein